MHCQLPQCARGWMLLLSACPGHRSGTGEFPVWRCRQGTKRAVRGTEWSGTCDKGCTWRLLSFKYLHSAWMSQVCAGL